MAVALCGAFAAYEAKSQQPGQVASGTAAFRRHDLPLADSIADGSGGGGKSDESSRSGQSARAAKSRALTRSRHPSGSAAANLRSAVRRDIASGNELLAVGQYMVEHGYTRAAAAGIASCVDGESAGNPESVGSGGGGLIGWTPINSAQPNANIITGNATQDMKTQLADILYYNSSEIGQSLVTQLNKINDPVAAADFFSENFEKPLVTNSDVVPAVAQQIFSVLGGL